MNNDEVLENVSVDSQKEELSGFKKYLLCVKKSILTIIIFMVVGLLLGLLIANLTYKNPYAEYNYTVLNFKYTSAISFDINDVVSDSNINRCKKLEKSLETGKKISTYKYVEIESISIEDNGTYYTIYCDTNSFNVGQDYAYSAVAAKGFLKHLTILPFITDEEIKTYNESELTYNEVFSNFDFNFYNENLNSDGNLNILYTNPNATRLNKEAKILYYTIWISSSFLTFSILALIFIFIFIDKLNIAFKKEYDNKNIYRTPFHHSFFKDSLNVFKDIKSLVMIAVLLALVMVFKFVPIFSGFSDLKIGFGFLFLAIACMLYGPYPALAIGLLSDVIGYLIRPDGPFFPGYTIQAMFACFTYALCLHKTYITFSRCLLARTIVNLVANVIIGSISRSIMMGLSFDATISYILIASLPKNLVYLLPQSLLLFVVLKGVSIPLGNMNILDKKITSNVSFF